LLYQASALAQAAADKSVGRRKMHENDFVNFGSSWFPGVFLKKRVELTETIMEINDLRDFDRVPN
jgi:hypothetical protein